MINKYIYPLFLLFILLLTSCMPKNDSDFKIITTGIKDIPEFQISPGEDLGFIRLGSDIKILTIKLYNSSQYTYKGMQFTLDNDETAGMTFQEDPSTNDKLYPGYGGTCGNTLEPKQECTIKIQYNPIIEGEFYQKLTWNYTNLLEPKEISKRIHLITAVPASLTFTNDTTFYDFGVIERTDITTERIQQLEIKNAGGLPASAINIKLSTITGYKDSFKIISNNCPSQLFKDETCQLTIKYQPQNYQCDDYPTAPDGSVRLLQYKTVLEIIYESDMNHNESHLNSTFTFLSTGIEGYMKFTGQDTFSFDTLIAGNEQTSTIAITNEGYKEAILRKLHIIHNGTHIAECTYDTASDYGNHFLTCKDPITKTIKPLYEFPFVIKDNQHCFSTESQLNYTRLSDSSLSDNTLRLVPGKDVSNPLSSGEACTFDISFHPSVKYRENEPEDKGKEYWQNIDFSLEYDSTWKDRIVIYNSPGSIVKDFTVKEAFYEYAAKIETVATIYNGIAQALTPFALVQSPYNTEFLNSSMPSPESPLRYNNIIISDFGNISLVSSSLDESERDQYRQSMRWILINTGVTDAENIVIQTFKDSSSSTPLTLDKDITVNTYYTVTQNNCATLTYGSLCDLSLSFLPMSDQKNDMFDQQVGTDNNNPYGYRRFVAYYNDGASYEDERNTDGTFIPRKKQATEFRLKAALVSKGLLTFYSQSSAGDWASDDSKTLVSGNQTYHDVILRNIGTGDISDLYLRDLSEVNDITSSSSTFSPAAIPYTAVKTGVNNNCLDIIDPTGLNLPGQNTFTDDPTYVIPADGGTCTLRFKVALPRDSNFLLTQSSYSGGSDGDEALGRTNLRSLSPSERLDWKHFPYSSVQAGGVLIGFEYKPDPADSTTKRILSSNGNGTYTISSKFISPSRLMVTKSSPYIASTAYKAPVDIDETEAGGSLITTPAYKLFQEGNLFPEEEVRYSHFSHIIQEGTTNLPTFNTDASSILDSNNYEYLVYGGIFEVSSTNKISFSIKKLGDAPLIGQVQFNQENRDSSFQAITGGHVGDSVESVTFTSSDTTLALNFNNSTPGIYYQDIDITYENGQFQKIGGIRVIENGNQTYTLTVRVVVEVIDSSDMLPIEISIADVPVTPGDGTPGTPETDESKLNYILYDLDTMPIVTLEDIRGGDELFTQKNIRIKNISSNSLDIDYLSKLISSKTAKYTLIGLETSGFTCSGDATTSQIPPGEYCQFYIRYTAGENSPSEVEDNYISIKTHITLPGDPAEEIFKLYQLPLHILSQDPAQLVVQGTSLQDIGTDANVSIVDLGFFNSSHIILDSDSVTTSSKTYTIANVGNNKASLLKQYELYQQAIGNDTPDPPQTDNTLIYKYVADNINFDKDVEIYANLACMYGSGNDENTPIEDRGFSDTSSCKITIVFNAKPDKFLINHIIDPNEYVLKINYYNYQDISYDFIKISFQGLVEPPLSHDIPGYNSVSATNNGDGTGSLTFSVNGAPNIDNQNTLGDITKYRILFTGIKNNLYDIYSLTLLSANGTISPGQVYYIDVSSLENIQISNLPEKTFFYIKVLPIRTFNNINYISHNHSQIEPNVLTVVIPGPGTTYSYLTKSIVDIDLISTDTCYRDECKNLCNQETTSYYKNGSNIILNKQLITRNILENYILTDPNLDDPDSSEINNYSVNYTSQWLADDPTDITEEGFDNTDDNSGVTSDNHKLYIKCDNSEGQCEIAFPYLSIMYGYVEDFGLPTGSYFFIDRNLAPGYARCYIAQ